jgi:hypothetical protein
MRDFDDNEFPLAYLITFRCYGIWLHGDERGSYRPSHGVMSGVSWIPVRPRLRKAGTPQLKHSPLRSIKSSAPSWRRLFVKFVFIASTDYAQLVSEPIMRTPLFPHSANQNLSLIPSNLTRQGHCGGRALCLLSSSNGPAMAARFICGKSGMWRKPWSMDC